jgi:hypothetical protein
MPESDVKRIDAAAAAARGSTHANTHVVNFQGPKRGACAHGDAQGIRAVVQYLAKFRCLLRTTRMLAIHAVQHGINRDEERQGHAQHQGELWIHEAACNTQQASDYHKNHG